jgi:hypothetical protein
MLASDAERKRADPFREKYGSGPGQIQITDATYPGFLRFLNLHFLQVDDGSDNEISIYDHFRSNADWRTDPRATDAAGNHVAQPVQPPKPIAPFLAPVDPTETQGVRAVKVSEFKAQMDQYLLLKGQFDTFMSLRRTIKSLLCDDFIVGTKAADAARGTGTEMVTDSMQTVLGRVDNTMGTPGGPAIKTMLAWYDIPYEDEPLAYYKAEGYLNTDLTKSSNNLTDNQRAEKIRKQHALRPEWTTVFAQYDFDHPVLSSRSWGSLKAFVISKEALITAGMTKSDMYPDPQGMAASSSPIAEAAPPIVPGVETPIAAFSANANDTMYSHADVVRIAQQAVQEFIATSAPGQTTRGRRTGGHRFESPNAITNSHHCDHHGICGHPSVGCKAIGDGMPAYHHSCDSRNGSRIVNGVSTVVHDPTRVYGHQNCRHTPKCKSAADAKRSTGPYHFPNMPGNRYQRPHSG